MKFRVIALVPLVQLAACGGADTTSKVPTNDVAAKAVADVDAAMADAQRTRVAGPPAARQ